MGICFPGAAATYGQPTSFAGKLFVGSEDGTVYALDSASGCRWWSFKASATVKTAISVGEEGSAAFFGDTNGFVYAVKVSDGSILWKVRPESHPAARITGSPLLVGKRLYVPISSGEEGSAADPTYPCCTFRGSIVALDTSSGKQIWRANTIADVPKPTTKNALGVQYWGPSGSPVWSTPTADLKRHAIYISTGNNYSDPPTDSSDAVIALAMKSGKKLWSRQFTAKDVWNSGCVAQNKDSCPSQPGDDYDFGAPPVLRSVGGGRNILLLAQKSGIVYAVDPDRRGSCCGKLASDTADRSEESNGVAQLTTALPIFRYRISISITRRLAEDCTRSIFGPENACGASLPRSQPAPVNSDAVRRKWHRQP